MTSTSQVSTLTHSRRAALVKKGRASWWIPRRTIDQVIKRAGIAG